MAQPTDRLQGLIDQLELQWESGSAPNVTQLVAEFGPLSPPELARLLLVDQAHRSSSGTPYGAADYFERFPELLQHAEAAIDLLYAEFLQREEREPDLTVDQFIQSYPQFQDEFRRQVSFHRCVFSESSENATFSSLAVQPTRSLTGDIEIPGYEILHELGRGGLGIVYLARDTRLNRHVALKMLLGRWFDSDNLPKRLLLEAEATARLQHPNIIQIYEVSQHAGHPILALEYISGGTLAAWMERRPQAPREAAQIVREVARAIQFAHERGVIHRDLKPSNLLLQPLSSSQASTASERWPDDELTGHRTSVRLRVDEMLIKVADFGLAKLIEVSAPDNAMPTLSGALIGTAAYMSPEQALVGSSSPAHASGPLTVATDIYSLGAILYELLTGRPPFVGVQPLEVLAQVINDEPIPPSQLVRPIERDLQTICLKCLEKNPNRRYATAAALADDLDRYLTGQPIIGRHVSKLEKVRRWCRRNPVKTAAVSLIACVLVMIASVSILYSTMLGKQLALTTQSQMVEESLKTKALGLLWEASLAQADALRSSHLDGQRFESLKAIESAWAMDHSLDISQSQVDRMRNATVAALALSDVRTVATLTRSWPTTAQLLSMDDSQTIGVYVSASGEAVVQRIDDGVELARISGCQPTSRIELSSDGTKLAIMDKRCRIYDVSVQACPILFETDADGPWTFSHDGLSAVGPNQVGELQRVELSDPRSIRTIGSFAKTKQIALSPNSQLLAMRRDDGIEVVDCVTGQMLWRVPAPAGENYQSFAWHPTSQVLAIGPDKNGIELWNVAGYRICSLPISGPAWFGFDRSGVRLLAYDLWNNTLRLWNIYNQELEFAQVGHEYRWLGKNADGGFDLLEIVDAVRLARVRVVCPSIYQVLPSLQTDFAVDPVEDLAYSPDGSLLAYSRGGQLEIFDPRTMNCLSRETLPRSYVQFASDGSLLTLSEFHLDERRSRVRGLNRWKRTITRQSESLSEIVFGPPEAVDQPSAKIANTPFSAATDNPLIAVARFDGVQVFSLDTPNPVRSQSTHSDVRRVSISPDGQRVATGGWRGDVCIWDTKSGQLQHTIREPSECLVQYSPVGHQLAVAADDIKVWDTQTWRLQYSIALNGSPHTGVSICFSPDGRTLAASDSYGRIHLHDSKKGNEYLVLTGPSTRRFFRLIYSPDGSQLVALSGFQAAGIWHLDKLQTQLNERELGWTASEQSAPLISHRESKHSSDQPSLPEASLKNSANHEHWEVTMLFDERFRQLEAGAMVEQARVATENHHFETAQFSIARALSLGVEDPARCNNLAWLLATGPVEIRDPAAAVKLAEAAMRGAGDAGLSLYANTLGVAQYRAGLFHESLATLKSSLAVQSPDSQAFDLYFLAMCSVELEDQDAAREYFKQAEELKERYRAEMAFDLQAELRRFHREAEAMLRQKTE